MDDVQIEDVVAAQGRFVVFIASLLQRGGVTPMSEFAHLLDTFAATVAETDPREAALLSTWSAGVRETLLH